MNAPAPLKHAIATLLAPMLMQPDPETAQQAAIHTLEAYGEAQDLLPLSRLIAFSLAALASLGQSMAQGLALADTIRLRNNAAACHRAAEQARRTLPAAPKPVPQVDEQAVHAKVAQAKSQLDQAARPPSPQHEAISRNAWAAAMTQVAQEFAADLANLPPDRKREASIKAQALATSAQSLLNGIDLEPFRLRV